MGRAARHNKTAWTNSNLQAIFEWSKRAETDLIESLEIKLVTRLMLGVENDVDVEQVCRFHVARLCYPYSALIDDVTRLFRNKLTAISLIAGHETP